MLKELEPAFAEPITDGEPIARQFGIPARNGPIRIPCVDIENHVIYQIPSIKQSRFTLKTLVESFLFAWIIAGSDGVRQLPNLSPASEIPVRRFNLAPTGKASRLDDVIVLLRAAEVGSRVGCLRVFPVFDRAPQ